MSLLRGGMEKQRTRRGGAEETVIELSEIETTGETPLAETRRFHRAEVLEVLS